jgi:hypothetical protein
MVLEANGENDTTGDPDPKEEAIDYIGGIVLKSKVSIYSYAEKDIVNYAKKQFILQSLGTVDLVADTVLTAYGKTNLSLFSDSMILAMGQNTLILAEGGAMMAGTGSTVLGQQDQNLGVMYDKDSKFVDIIKGVLDTSTLSAELGKAKKDKQKLLKKTTFQSEDKFEDLQFKFLKSEKYSVSSDEDAIPMTMAQQDDLLTSSYNLSEWEEKEVNSTYPYPGKDLFENFYYSSEKPVNLEEKQVSKDYVNKSEAENKPAKITLESLTKYKVQP